MKLEECRAGFSKGVPACQKPNRSHRCRPNHGWLKKGAYDRANRLRQPLNQKGTSSKTSINTKTKME